MSAQRNRKDLSNYPLAGGERTIPYNLEAEKALLGSMMLSPDAISVALEIVVPEDLYSQGNRLLFNSISSLYGRGEPTDPVTVAADLKVKDQLEVCGGIEYLYELLQAVPTAANVKYYADIVEKCSVYRSMIGAGGEIANLGFEAPDDVHAALDQAESVIYGIAHRSRTESFVHIKDLLPDVYDTAVHAKTKDSGGIPSGFSELDKVIGGFHPSDLIIIAARPGMGKTALAINIAENVTSKQKIPVGIFSLEMSKEQIVQRLLCSTARINTKNMKEGDIRDDEWSKISDAMNFLNECPIYIDDTASVTVMQIRAKARRLKSRNQLGMIIIDYLQLMQGTSRDGNRYTDISEISRGLKILARELSIPIIAVSQLSREVEKRPDKHPQLSDLRESGAIEQDADLVMFIYRDEYYDKDSQKRGIAEVDIAKHRNGPSGHCELTFNGAYSKFSSLGGVSPQKVKRDPTDNDYSNN